MIHYGDITKIHGDQVPAVHVITGGSPCQPVWASEIEGFPIAVTKKRLGEE